MSQPVNNSESIFNYAAFSACAVVPHFNHPQRIAAVVTALHEYELPVIIIDDGSDESARQILLDLENDKVDSRQTLIVHYKPFNQGKGAAVLKGLEIASELGFSHAIQVDADGQHSLDKLPDMLACARKSPTALLSGKPVYDESVPKSRLYGRRINHFWVAIETLSHQLEDTMCGLRIYPVEPTLATNRAHPTAPRMEFDTEIMVRMYWAGFPMYFFPVAVNYPEDGSSHYKLFIDNSRQIRMHIGLVFGMLFRLPRFMIRRFNLKRNNHTSWSTIQERGSLAGMRFVTVLNRLLGKRVSSQFLWPISLYYFLTHGSARRASQKFLHRVYPYTQGQARKASRPGFFNVLRHFHSFAISTLDKVSVWGNSNGEHAPDYKNGQLLKQALSQGRGLLLISAHIGNLEFCRALATLNNRLRINALVYTKNAQKFNRLLESLSQRYRFRLILVENIGMETGIMLREMIDRGEIVVIVGDRTPANETSQTVLVNFLGEEAAFATGPYVLAHILECPVQLLICARNSNKHTIHLEAFEDRIHLPRKNRQQAMEQFAQRYADRLTYYAAKYPLQWFNFFDIWAKPDTTEPTNHHE